MEEEESEEDDSEPDPEALLAGGDEDNSGEGGSNQFRYQAGTFVVAKYDKEWFIAQVENSQVNVPSGYTRLRYMSKKGYNRFVWEKPDILDTLDLDILLTIPDPIPVASRFMGLNESTAKQADRLLVVHVVSLFFTFKISSLKIYFLL